MDHHEYGVEERRHSRGFVSALFRKKARPEHSLFEAKGDEAADGLAPRAGSSKGRWGLLSRKSSGKHASALELQKDAEFFRSECLRQGQELQEAQYRLEGSEARNAELQQRLNLERFKYELLVDLWAMRVLDNEELAAQGGRATAA